MYAVKFTRCGLADVKALPKNVKNGLRKQLAGTLARDPVGCSEELQAPLTGFRSFHWRQYRIVFRVFPALRVVAIAGVGKHSKSAREDIYRRLEALVKTASLADSVLVSLRGLLDGP